MSDPKVDRFKQRGSVWLWRDVSHRRNFPGWNVTADVEGCSSLVELLSRMINSNWGSSKTILLADLPEIIANNCERLVAPDEWTVQCTKHSNDEHWKWTGSSSAPRLKCDESMLKEIRVAIENVANGRGDFRLGSELQSIHDSEESILSLWFWPLTCV